MTDQHAVTRQDTDQQNSGYYSPPAAVELPKGGGAIRGIGEKFSVNPITGTGSLSIPIFSTPGRAGFSPQLSLSYDSGAGNGAFGLGWNLSIPSITRKTDKGLPRYLDDEDSDVFILSGAEDLVPTLIPEGNTWVKDERPEGDFIIRRYRPRIEGLFARIERWQHRGTGEIHWRSISKDNVTSIYGRSPQLLHSQIADPADGSRVLKWLLEASYDDRGNLIVYEYKSENDENVEPSAVQEGHRTEQDYKANVYLKRVWYGNRTPYRQAGGPVWSENSDINNYLDIIENNSDLNYWLFQVVFDYGEHGSIDPRLDEGNWDNLTPADLVADIPIPDDPTRSWFTRPDAFSTYRAGFEVRTQRLCRRVLMFHRMDEKGAIGADWHLIRSTDFGYDKNPVATYLVAAKQTGYVRDGEGYHRRWMPPLEMHYDRPQFHTEIQTVDPNSLENLPIGLDGRQYQWVDLDSEGISGILTEQGTGWFYKRNLGEAQFGEAELVATKPSVAVLQSPQQRVMDLAGDGTQDIVLLGNLSGYCQREADGEWRNFQSFESVPIVDWADPNLRFIDLNGDGHADILIAQDELFVWYPSKARQGFGAAETVRKAQDEERGAALVFADGTQSVYLADMSGDGLNDLVRIRNGEVCYWPSLGYGRFGARVTMAGAPWFDHPELFDQQRVRLADIDGSGTTDILYLGREEIAIWLNQAGNGFWKYGSEPGETPLTQFPTVDDLTAVQAIDLLGNGTACLVWSSPLPGLQPMRYIDLMGGQKPHLMTSVVNNLGAETKLQYAASTKFYLRDRREGNPWITRLPFPVHVVERVETIDHLTGNRFVNLYRYRHGYFDGEEREFRGFGYVEQTDTEAYAELAKGNMFEVGTNEEESSHVPPVRTKTWFHTGAFIDREHLSQLFAEEYYKGDAQAVFLPDTVLPDGLTTTITEKIDNETTERIDDEIEETRTIKLPHKLTAQEEREACRALKGSVLRQEVYALDGTEEAEHPYTVTESNYEIRQLQPQEENRHAVFFAHPSESLAYHYERNPADPRVAHQMTLEVDGFSNGLKSAAIAYPRRNPAYPEQGQTYITYSENRVTNKPNDLPGEPDWYRIGLPVETCTYEITGIEGTMSPSFTPFTLDNLREQIETAEAIDYETFAGSGIQKRLIEQVRTLYRNNGDAHRLDPAPLPLGEVDSLALPCESFKRAFTETQLRPIYGEKLTETELETVLENEGRYVRLDSPWWIPSGRQAFDADHFYLPYKTQDPFGQCYTLAYDGEWLLVERTEDPVQNVVQIANNYRVMQPEKITDPNGNQAEVAFDTLGLVAGTAVMGKGEEPDEGDSLAEFDADLNESQDAFWQDPLGTAAGLLGTATTRIIYDVERYQNTGQPAVAATLARETHVSDPVPADGLKVQVSFLYSDGFGRELQTKIQAEPGDAPRRGADGVLKCTENLVHTDPRWVGTGRTIYNNKGKPVKQYEPFFSPTHKYETEPGLVECGVTPILFYDPLGRVVATLHPNKTYEKVVFDPWQQTTWDVNDTLTETTREDPTEDKDVGTYFKVLNAEEYLPTWYTRYSNGSAVERDAAKKAADHAGTPSVAHLDTLGRPFLTIAHNGWNSAGEAQLYETRVEQDIEGQSLTITDARGNRVMVNTLEVEGQRIRTYDLLGNGLYSHSSDAGERWMLNNVAGNPMRGWDSRGHTLRYTYDGLQRPVGLYVRGGDHSEEILAECTVYGEGVPEAAQRNLRGQVYQVFDAAGVVTSEGYDFKGNLLKSTRQLVKDYRTLPDWSGSPGLELEIYGSRTVYDALNRPIQLVAPHDITGETVETDVFQPVYNEANLLEQMPVWLKHSGDPTALLDLQTADLTTVQTIDYNAKGQRTRIKYGNGVTTRYTYDPETFRLKHLYTRRGATFTEDCGSEPPPPRFAAPAEPPADQPCGLQNLHYTYDPVGNITAIRDDAQPTIFFRNQVVRACSEYTYDALYRLINATGREHLGQKPDGSRKAPTPMGPDDALRINQPHPENGKAMGRYRQQYVYDEVGNILEMIHRGTDPDHPGWRRCYQYALDSNRLLSTGYQSDPFVSCDPDRHYAAEASYPQKYRYDLHGNMNRMPHLPMMQWDFKDQLQASSKQERTDGGTPEITYYVYDAAGQRVRKVTERQADPDEVPSQWKERIYLGGFEVYRQYRGDGKTVKLERETLHVMDDQQRIALVETRNDIDDGTRKNTIRYQFGNHLGSISLEFDEKARIISYEEYYPYGNTSFQMSRSRAETGLKRYKYTGKERDLESDLDYYGLRYYAPHLGTWISCDPKGFIDGENLYNFSKSNPVLYVDRTGGDSYYFYRNESKEWNLTVVESKGDSEGEFKESKDRFFYTEEILDNSDIKKTEFDEFQELSLGEFKTQKQAKDFYLSEDRVGSETENLSAMVRTVLSESSPFTTYTERVSLAEEIRNRAMSSKYPKLFGNVHTYSEVVFKPEQYSPATHKKAKKHAVNQFLKPVSKAIRENLVESIKASLNAHFDNTNIADSALFHRAKGNSGFQEDIDKGKVMKVNIKGSSNTTEFYKLKNWDFLSSKEDLENNKLLIDEVLERSLESNEASYLLRKCILY
ncbi:RHS repeat-associated core domain protein [Leptolyngbya sp. PCC 7375]|nr:RHS repeat-associated core domain protein [Leptolyngbya sp. PCC 7375]